MKNHTLTKVTQHSSREIRGIAKALPMKVEDKERNVTIFINYPFIFLIYMLSVQKKLLRQVVDLTPTSNETRCC